MLRLTVDRLRRNASASSTKSKSLSKSKNAHLNLMILCSPQLKHQWAAYPWRLVLAQSNTLCMAVTPSRPIGATSPPVIMA